MTIIKTLNQLARCTNKTLNSDGSVTIECKLGLWSVSSTSLVTVTEEALHFFKQYKADGEYHSIIGGLSPSDLLTRDRQPQ